MILVPSIPAAPVKKQGMKRFRKSTKGGFLAIQAVAAVLFLILIASLALALGADTKALKPSVLDKLSAKACNAMYQGRKMLHCCGISNHEPWDFAWLPYCWQNCNAEGHCRSGNSVKSCS